MKNSIQDTKITSKIYQIWYTLIFDFHSDTKWIIVAGFTLEKCVDNQLKNAYTVSQPNIQVWRTNLM
jgi:hypothetical protein